MPTMQELQARANDLLTATPPALAAVRGPTRRFSAFIPQDVEAAAALAEEFMRLAEQAPTPEDGLERVLQFAQQRRDTADPALIQHALMIFIVHHPQGSRLEILPLEQRNPPRYWPRRRRKPPSWLLPAKDSSIGIAKTRWPTSTMSTGT
jgi:hypothetical protein